MDRPTVIYLDWNVISAFVSGGNGFVLQMLTDEVEAGRVVIPYSYAHVLEIANITDYNDRSKEELQDDSLAVLSNLTSELYIRVQGDDSRATLEQMPIRPIFRFVQSIKPILELPFPQDERPDIKSIRARRTEFGLNPNELNNLPPDQVVERINEILAAEETISRFPNDEVVGKSVEQLVNDAANKSEALISALGATAGIGGRMAIFYTLIDAFGYWPDAGKRNAARSQFIDANHKSTARWADVYVTDDVKHRMKTLATYSYFGIATPVISSDDVGAWLNGCT